MWRAPSQLNVFFDLRGGMCVGMSRGGVVLWMSRRGISDQELVHE